MKTLPVEWVQVPVGIEYVAALSSHDFSALKLSGRPMARSVGGKGHWLGYAQ